jgi:hypothetical protein
MRRFLFVMVISAAAGVMMAQPVLACGGLVAANGAVVLQRTTTLAAYHDGVEHYVTSFQYAGTQTEFGSIIPLPGVPTDVRRAGSWTLQRLERETHPPVFAARGATTAALAAPSAQVLLQTTVDALDITVLSGGGDAVLTWVKDHGYAVSPDAPAMLDFYARRSPVFLAARFNAAKAQARQQRVGDGTPVQITIPTANPWVPLHILSLAKIAAAPVQADVYLLTDRAPALLGLDTGVTVQASQPASDSLLADLRSDKDSGWIPQQSWLTFVGIDTPAGRLNHDLAIDPSGARQPSPVQAGYDPTLGYPGVQLAGLRPIAVPGRPVSVARIALIGGVVGLIILVLAIGAVVTTARRRLMTGVASQQPH